MSDLVRARTVETAGLAALRWSLVLIFLWFGALKFTAYEAEGVSGLAQTYFLFQWLYPLFGVQGASNVIGVLELSAAVFLALGARSAAASLIGGLMGVATFTVTLSFMLTAPGVAQEGYGFPALGMTGQFLIKDAVLWAGCFALANEARKRLRSGFAALPAPAAAHAAE